MQSAESSQKAYEEDEREEREEIASLVSKLPVLNDLFQLHFKIGEGTFSSVFLATLKTSEGVKKFAVKHLVPTCHVGRVERELKCLQNIGGTDHIVGLELCLRNAGSIVFIMPYLKHDRFSEYVYDMDVYETRDYMKALLTALRRVHKFGIIHRDVKPSNFLYDRCNRRYLLVDFGLAQQYNVENKSSSDLKVEVSENQTSKRKRSDENTVREPVEVTKRSTEGKCVCFGKPKICSLCIVRPPQTAPRAGTPGFRAPEVLLKYLFQTPAIDIWASGVMMLSILSGTQPFFRASDDCTALAEITTLFGSNRIQQCARKLGTSRFKLSNTGV
ncbi:cell division cycle 7-related protein kinase isoform X2 [Orussus abietinus]|uniref:cell division cycle 7-related protein kinase isoform X2 n=1 Tax=Orussus abietinus TaxID=222816 RepID=UPI000625310E|nr:cell division cycle 7-related protein kinase isoform X2 [Orussus abietinus]